MYKYILFLISMVTYHVHIAQSLDNFLDKELNPIEIGKNATGFTFIEHTDSTKTSQRGTSTYVFKKEGVLESFYSPGQGECRHGMRYLVKGSWKKVSASKISIYMKTQTNTNQSVHVYEAEYNYKIEGDALLLTRTKLITDKNVKK